MYRALASLLTASFAVLSVYADTERAVTVGYYPVPGMMEGTEPDAAKSGYAYEYIQEIASRAGWRYKYVCGSFKEVYAKLRSGEIDILPYVNYSDVRAKEVAFPAQAMGSERFYLAWRTRETRVKAPSELAGKKVGMEAGAFDSVPFVELMKAHGLAYELVEFCGVQQRWNALEKGEIDFSIETSSMCQRDGIYAAYALPGEHPYHLAVSPQRKDLLAELNDAQERLAQDDPGFLHRLKFKYFGKVPIFKALPPAAKEWLQEHKVIRIGTYEGMKPYVYRDDKGDIVGMAPDGLRLMLDELGVDTQVEWILFSGRDSGLWALKQNEVDLLYPFYHNRADAEREQVIISSVVFGSPFGLAYRGEYSSETLARIASPITRLGYKYVRDEYPDSKCIRCVTGHECVEKVRTGEATSVAMYLPILQQIVADINDPEINLKTLSSPCNVCFAALPSNSALIGLINKAIPYLDHLKRNEIENRHQIECSPHAGSLYFTRKHPIYMAVAITLGVAVVILLLAHLGYAKRTAVFKLSLAKLRAELLNLSERKEILDCFMNTFAFASKIDLNKGTFSVLNRDRAFPLAFREGGRWQDELLDFIEKYVHPDDRAELILLADGGKVSSMLTAADSFSLPVTVRLQPMDRSMLVTLIRCGDSGCFALGFTYVPCMSCHQSKTKGQKA